MDSLTELFEKYRNYRNVEFEFILKNVTKERFYAIKSYLETTKIYATEINTVDKFIGDNVRITDDEIAVRKTRKDKIDYSDFYVNIKLESPVENCIINNSKVLYTRTKKRIRYSEKYIYIDLTYVYESDSYEIEIEIDPLLSLCHSSKHIIKKCMMHLHSFGANI